MRILKNDLTHYFIRPHEELPRSYLASCKKFFKSIKPQAASAKLQATSLTNQDSGIIKDVERNKLCHTLEKKTD